MSGKRRFSLLLLPLLAAAAGLTGCIQIPRPADSQQVAALKTALTSLSPTVRDDVANGIAQCAYDYSRTLAERYRVVRPPKLQNMLVNAGIKPRGLCFQWAEDMLAEIQTLDLDTVELHWGVSMADTRHEHNCIVVTAIGQQFADGIVLDAWRRSGRLVWSPVATDSYLWGEVRMTTGSTAHTASTGMR